jgi:hypothetical protein
MSALERAEADIIAGNYGLARMRLESYVSSEGYDAALLSRIGQICYDMHDPFNAGRMWVVSPAQGEHVDRAIDFFLKSAHHDPRQAAGQILPGARRPSLDDYPPKVQERLRQLGLAEAVIEGKTTMTPRKRAFRDRMAVGVFMAIALACVGSCVVGLKTIVSWAF